MNNSPVYRAFLGGKPSKHSLSSNILRYVISRNLLTWILTAEITSNFIQINLNSYANLTQDVLRHGVTDCISNTHPWFWHILLSTDYCTCQSYLLYVRLLRTRALSAGTMVLQMVMSKRTRWIVSTLCEFLQTQHTHLGSNNLFETNGGGRPNHCIHKIYRIWRSLYYYTPDWSFTHLCCSSSGGPIIVLRCEQRLECVEKFQ